VALDLTLTEELEEEGLARELVNRIQNLRKDKGLEVTDRINLSILDQANINKAVTNNLKYICAETLAEKLELVSVLESPDSVEVELVGDLRTQINITTLN
jgi:isoleucyl-tRNA synthetase